MNIAINFFVMMTLFFAGMAQAHAMNPRTAYAIAGTSALVAMGLAIVRYSQQKSSRK